MPCFHPLDAWQLADGQVVFKPAASYARPLNLPCGRCVGCRLERSRQWAVRCMHEASLHDVNSFVTLTYQDDCVPDFGSLRHRDFQLFMKRLRKAYGPTKFYMCGEYGETFSRPHYHACLFGCHFADRVLHSDRGGVRLYVSERLNALWPHGFASLGDVTFESAAYVARYVMKKVTGDLAESHYRRVDTRTGEVVSVEPEYSRMSLRPAIARDWFDRFASDVYPQDLVVSNGHPAKPPRYYDKLLADVDAAMSLAVKWEREYNACVEDASPDRLAVRERVATARLNLKKRSIQ